MLTCQRAIIIGIVCFIFLCGAVSIANAFEVKIGAIDQAYLGHTVTVPIYFTGNTRPFGGFDFLLAYDPDQLKSPRVTLGDYFADCGWEYFTYQLASEYCGSGCPTGHIRIIGQADVADGTPFEFDCLAAADPDEIVFNLEFTVVREYDNQGSFLPVRFLWQTCDDNIIIGQNGDSLFLSAQIFNCDYLDGQAMYSGVAAGDWELPSLLGAPEACLAGSGQSTVTPAIDYYNGGVCVVDDDANYRGDINVNEVAYEIADAVMYTNYFINGLAAFGDHVDTSIAASDVNNDGEPLTVADLNYLVHVIIGDAVPYPVPTPWAQLNVVTQDANDALRVAVETNVEVGAMLLIFDVTGTIGNPDLHNSMDMVYNLDDGELRVLIYNIGTESITSGELLTIPCSGTIVLQEVDASDYVGCVLHADFPPLPQQWEVAQNYPNPFTPSIVTPKTTIPISLAFGSEYSVDIFNSIGQRVKTFSGSGQAGVLDVVWDGTNGNGRTAASGMYFYKVTIGDRSITRKMILTR